MSQKVKTTPRKTTQNQTQRPTKTTRSQTSHPVKTAQNQAVQTPNPPNPRLSLHLTKIESALTAGLLAMSIMTPFFNSIGLDAAEIALTQIIFTLVVSILNLPAGWLADRFSRKWANVIGDFGAALTFLAYSQVHGFAGVVICESLLGIFMAFSQGVDASLLKHFAHQVRPGRQFFQRQAASLGFWQYLCSLILVLLGGPIGALDFRLAIALSSAVYFLGGLASLFIHDDSARLQPVHRNPLRDIARVTRTSLTHPALRLRLLAYAIGRELTHGLIWVFTPILLFVGVPLPIVSAAWAINSLANIVGARLATRFAHRLAEWQLLAIPLTLAIISLGTMSISLNLITVWLYTLMGIIQGWTGAALLPLVQEHASAREQTSVVSLAKVISQLVYIPTVWLIGWAADFNLQFAMVMTLVLFIPAGAIICLRLRQGSLKDQS